MLDVLQGNDQHLTKSGKVVLFEILAMPDSFFSWVNIDYRWKMVSLRRIKSLENLGRRRKMEMSLTW